MPDNIFSKPYGEKIVEEAILNLKSNMITDRAILEKEVLDWLRSPVRKKMLTAQRYYENHTDIQDKARELEWQTNTKLEHDFYRMLVDQKVEFLLEKPPTVEAETEEGQEAAEERFDDGMWRKIRDVLTEAVSKGVSYLHPYVDEAGELKYMKFRSEEIRVFYDDPEEMRVGSFLRVYDQYRYVNGDKTLVTLVDYYHAAGVDHYILEMDGLVPDGARNFESTYLKVEGEARTFPAVPLIHFRYNKEKTPLLDRVKTLIDAYNLAESTNIDTLADIPNFIYVLKNYLGEDLGDFIRNLNRYRVLTVDHDGGVEALQADLDALAHGGDIVGRLRYAIYESGRGVDTREALGGNASGEALKMRYANLKMDVASLATETLSSLEYLNEFVSSYENEEARPVMITFNSTVIESEKEILEAEEKLVDIANASKGIIDDKTIREHHPWYSLDVEKRLEEQQAEEERLLNEMYGPDMVDHPITDGEEDG